MVSSPAYLFLEVAIIVYVFGFGWEHWRAAKLNSPTWTVAAIFLAAFWFALDQIALHLGLWTFPQGGSLSIRLAALPIEEYILFFMHTVICLILLKRYSKEN